MARRKLFQEETEGLTSEQKYLEEISKINEYLASINIISDISLNLKNRNDNEREIDDLHQMLLKDEILNEDQCRKLNQSLIANNAIIFNFMKIINVKDNESFISFHKINESTLKTIKDHVSNFCRKIITFHNKNILADAMYKILSKDVELLSNIYKYYESSKSIPSLQFCIIEKLVDIHTKHANVTDTINSTLKNIDRLSSLFKTLKIIKKHLALSIDTRIDNNSNIDIEKESQNTKSDIDYDDIKILLDNLSLNQDVQLSGDY